ncbi:hypothetical protein SI65_06739 [Aspergillus cristatus]|uniref:Uncharacterized protein n=1 Tax=Aspergillus cristatus TaxID=573508 RepID=A0A1E3BB00_ASPCR|nr:hypothetical protein SI65_06739 [Aspergillus cristatus]
MLRLSKSSPAPPFAHTKEWMRRWLNKKLGRPATPKVGILGNSIHQLSLASHPPFRTILQDSKIDTDNPVIVATPTFPALRLSDLYDAIEYAGLESWLTPEIGYPGVLSESNAAFGAHGYGLCENYKSDYDCEDESYELPRERVYSAAFGWGSGLKTRHICLMRGVEGLDVDPTFAAARGAALYGRWRQEAPLGCVERDECEEERQREREGKSPRIIDDEP